MLDVSQVMHDCRGTYLRSMPPGAQVLLSAGCAGTWYFDWIRSTYGPVQRHIGIEYYMPKPKDLPPEVEWIENTASDMSGVKDATCDLVFSGQNLEHLWPEEVAGFLAEAARVTKPGGHLVVDSPNRLLTKPLNWSHPEHTVELTVDEALELVAMAGFDVTKCTGIWLCRDPRTGRILPFDPNSSDPEWSLEERLRVAQDHPRDSFLWWIEAKRNGKPADVAGLHARMRAIFVGAWTDRAQRTLVAAGQPVRRGGVDWVDVSEGTGGAIIYGPFMPLKAGRHRATFMLDIAPGVTGPVGYVEAITGSMRQVAMAEVAGGGFQPVTLEFSLDQLEFGMQFRCVSNAQAMFAVRRIVDVVSL